MEITKKDWELFRKRIGEWQEAYMDRLNKEYIELLEEEKPASIKFWELEKRIRQDRKKPGVIIEMSKWEVPYHLVNLLQDEAITIDDLEGFSKDLVEHVKKIASRE